MKRILGRNNLLELLLTVSIFGFLLKFILRKPPGGCIFWVPIVISPFDIIFIIYLNIISIFSFILFYYDRINGRKNDVFLNLRVANLVLSLLSLFYLINWFDKFCISYRIWVSIYSFISLPCCLIFPFIYLIFIRFKQHKLELKIFKPQNLKKILSKFLTSFKLIVFEILLVICVILYSYTLPFSYPFSVYGCGFEQFYGVRLLTVFFFILVLLISIISFIKPLFSKDLRISDLSPLILLRSINIVTVLLGIKYFISYQTGNCIKISQEAWILIKSFNWVLTIPLLLFLFKCLIILIIYFMRNSLRK